ncbi:hypothetical protein Pfo_016445, partial [Paulownia fortunei]
RPRATPPPSLIHRGRIIHQTTVSPDVSDSKLKVLFESHGEVLSVNSYPSRNYARSARQGLQGHVLRGNRLKIEFAKPELGLDAKESQFPSRYLAPSELQWIAENSLNNYPSLILLEPKDKISELGHKKDFIAQHPGAKAHFREFPFRPVQMDILGLNRPVLPARPPSLGLCGPHVYMRPPFLGPHSTFKPALPGPKNPGYQTVIGGPNWRYISGAWDVSDSSQLQRESERSRLVAAMPPERTENQGGFDENYGLTSQNSGGASGSLTSVKTGGLGQLHSESNCIWRGIIAKAGTPVCHARCVPVGEGIDAHMAGVAKFDKGSTLFLVPPSDFLAKVLNVSGPERLYGVFLKFPEVVSTSPSMNPQSIQPHYGDPHKNTSLQTGYSPVPPKERVLPEDLKMPPKAPGPVSS